jgi:hypothetical protein
MFGDRVHDNRANLSHSANSGGGGVSFRNSSLRMSNVTIDENAVEGFAGGGVIFSTAAEGTETENEEVDLGEPWLPEFDIPVEYDRILHEVFGVTEIVLEIVGSTSITDNHCIQTDSFVDNRKGGGLYVVRLAYVDGEGNPFEGIPFLVSIEEFNGITNNHNDEVLGPPTVPEPGGVTFPDSRDLHLDDQVNRPNNPIDASNAQDFVVGDQFEYPAQT